ncbi:PKD domain-containing protein, partial [Patescibacteria group bacterium]|nr:PKD domain-containing protein [Patescibacteria group bacterium]
RIEDIQNVSGIGPSTYAGIEPFITVGDTAAGTSDNGSATASSTQSTQVSSTGAAAYTPPPSVLVIEAGTDRSAVLEVPLHLSAVVKTKGGAADPSAHIAWSFGDGSSGEGSATEKTYRYAGTYLVKVEATDGATSAEDEFTVLVKPALVRITAVSNDGIRIANDANDQLDLSLWRLSAGTGFFRIPNGTVLLPNGSVLFSSAITNLPIALDATLAYPDGVIAARYLPAPGTQPSVPDASSTEEQTVKYPVGYNEIPPVLNKGVSGTAHGAEAARAPAAATEFAAAGAALSNPAIPAEESGTAGAPRALGVFRSPWLLGLFGVMALAGGAFILL